MVAELSERVRELAEARDVPESEAFERSLEDGLEDHWDSLVLFRYLDCELGRDRADRVELANVERGSENRGSSRKTSTGA